MKTYLMVSQMLILLSFTALIFSACSQKTGCPSNGKNVGAEKLLNGGKPPKAKKFKA